MLSCATPRIAQELRWRVGGMKYELIETENEWVVQNEGVEEARYEAQDEALDHVARRLKTAAAEDKAVSLSVRYRAKKDRPATELSGRGVQARISK